MAFTREICTPEVFRQLALPESLASNDELNPLARQLIFELSSKSALIPHPYHYTDFPDRRLSFFVGGKYFGGWEFIQGTDTPERIEIFFDKASTAEERASITFLLQGAVAVLRNEAVGAVPIQQSKKWS